MQSGSVAVTNVAWSAAGWVALLLLGASIASDLGAAQLTAANDIEVEAAQTRHDNSSETFVKKSGILSTTKTTNIDRSQNTLAEGSLVTGDSVQLQSGRDLMVRGGIVPADNDVSLVAGRDIDIVEARDFESRNSIRIKKKSGLFGITLGSTSAVRIARIAGRACAAPWVHRAFPGGVFYCPIILLGRTAAQRRQACESISAQPIRGSGIDQA